MSIARTSLPPRAAQMNDVALRANDVLRNDVHRVSDVMPDGVVGKHHIILRQRCNTSLWRSHNITSAEPQHHFYLFSSPPNLRTESNRCHGRAFVI